MTIKKIIVSGAVLAALLICANASTIQEQWTHSPHARSLDDPGERASVNKTGCANCHTAQGYWEVILQNKRSTAPYKEPIGITCIACHLSDTDPALRARDVKKSCDGCHDMLVQNDEKKFSSAPQGSFVAGKGGVEFPGETYPKGPHGEIEKNCSHCHLAKFTAGSDTLVGGHTFRVISKGTESRVFNAAGCTGCHENISFEYVKKSQQEVKELLDTLAALLPQKTEKDPKKPEENPRLPRDSSLSPVEATASFNYYQVLKDGTFGVHNPPYIRKLLKDSIAALKKEKSGN